ncbi:MAG: GNAT family N-acetyltransferase, partial [Actinobacteria bacterium]|nr:GNAT family N-acetyltransferase [Actinomycetota bacterium]
LAARLVVGRRVCTSVVGRAEAVAGLWSVVGPTWGRPRAVREEQPLLVLDRADELPAGDPRVRAMRPSELDRYLPAATAMFTEELGVSPYRSSPVADYRRRVAGLIAEGRAFGIVDDSGAVVFKADIGAVSDHTCQLQGVWVRPDRRGQGLGHAALAAVLRQALTFAPSVSLYVNAYNVAARRLYDRLGMREVATLTTILF